MKNIGRYLTIFITVFVATLIITVLYTAVKSSYFSPEHLKTSVFYIRFLLFYFLSFLFSVYFVFDAKDICSWLYKNRYFIGLFIILFAVAFELNNSSMGQLGYFLDHKYYDENIVLGSVKSNCSDEYAISTPVIFCQHSQNYPYFNNILRGTETNMSLICAQPVKNIITVYKPFFWGFFFLDFPKGFSFLWIAKLLCLFFVTFEFLMLLTQRSKSLSFMGTLLITFAPNFHWWWGAMSDIVLCGEIVILLVYGYFLQRNFIKKSLMLFFTFIFTGYFILIFIPAWQVPSAYIFAVVFLCLILPSYKNFKFERKDIFAFFCFSVFFGLIFVYFYSKSKQAIDIITHTAYPGARFETGGNYSLTNLFRQWGNLFFSLQPEFPGFHACEMSCVFDFFPIGIILSFIVLFKDKIKDKLLIFLLILDLFFAVFLFAGFPEFLAQISLLKVSPERRFFVPFGFLNLLILIRALSLVKYNISKFYIVLISFILTDITILCNVIYYSAYMRDIIKIAVIAVTSFSAYYLLLSHKINKKLIFLAVFISFFSGALVNPIQKGIAPIQDSYLLNIVKKINDIKPGLWLAEMGFPIPNSLIAKGVATFNSMNIYPNLDAFEKLDPDKKYIDIYNRYCNIDVNIVEKVLPEQDKFILKNISYIGINITPEDIKTLGINYILTYRSLESFSNDKIKFEKLFEAENFYIYGVS